MNTRNTRVLNCIIASFATPAGLVDKLGGR